MSCSSSEKLFFEKLRRYYLENPGRCCDVTFLLGPQKEVVKTSRIILEVVCPEFIKLFDETWGQAVSIQTNDNETENGIPLPLVDPNAFKIFLKLLIADDISVVALESLELSATDLLNVTHLCLEYKMNFIHQNLEMVMQKTVLNDFSTFSKSADFLNLSEAHLKTILSSNEFPADETEIVKAALQWAEFQCSKRKLENTGENKRQVLGDALFQIRFSTLSAVDFARESGLRDILTDKEQIGIFRSITLGEEEKASPDLQFCTIKRKSTYYFTLDFLKEFSVSGSSSYVCDGSRKNTAFKVNQPIAIEGIEFLGPIDADSYYDVSLEIKSFVNNTSGTSCGKVEKRVVAKQNELFYVAFDEPIKVEATYVRDDFRLYDFYQAYFSLKGPNTTCGAVIASGYKDFRADTDAGVTFYCRWHNNNPLAKFRFKKC